MDNRRSDTIDPPVKPRTKVPLPASDGRSSEAKAHKRLLDSILFHLNVDRIESRPPTEAETALAERATALLLRLEVYNAKIEVGEEINDREYINLGKAALAAMDALGITPLKPKPRRRGSYY